MRKHQTNDTIFTSENDLSFYLLGAFMTDGNITIDKNGNHRISIASNDEEWIIALQQLIVPQAKIKKDSRVNCYEIRFRSEIIKDWLISYGCTPHKSNTLKIEKQIPAQYTFDFLRGIMDGDGCICASHYTKRLASGIKKYPRLDFYITTGSKQFGEQIQKLIEPMCKCILYTKNRKEIVMTNGKIIKPTTYWYVQSGRIEVKNFLDTIYYSTNKLNLARKQKIVDQYCRTI
jgi:intein/homing endonuclease